MGIHHLISIDEDQLRNWRGDPDDLMRNIGSAVLVACLDPTNRGVTIDAGSAGAEGGEVGTLIAVRHVDKYEGDEFAVWAWSVGEEVCIADLPNEDVALLCKMSNAVLQGHFADGGGQ